MAEVYLGTHEALGGFQKLVVMKRLSGWQSSDPEAVDRLLDEARIAATINHPNVVTTLDIGRDGDQPYIVLEYLSGEDLRYILHDLHGRDASVPLGIACRIGASIAAALHQAHELTLPDGSRRCIVHRDVTPSNIIVCYSGVTKLVDFGVARVVDDVPKTQAGMVKGKFSYLAPEQLSGDPIDGRTDVFQLGIVLWEMVTMQRLFEGKSDHERLNAVLNRKIRPPSQLNPALPSCLDATILRALERDPKARHQTAHELEVELLDALTMLGGSGGDHSVGQWMQKAFATRQRWRQDLERRTLSELDKEVEIEPVSVGTGTSSRRFATSSLRTASGRLVTSSTLGGVAAEQLTPPPSRGIWRKLAIPLAVAIAGVIWWQVTRAPASDKDEQPVAATTATKPAPSDYEIDIRVVPEHASIEIDGKEIAKGRYRASFADDGEVHTVTLTAPNHATVHRRFRGPATMEIALEPLTGPTPSTGTAQALEVTAPDDGEAARKRGSKRRATGDARTAPTQRPVVRRGSAGSASVTPDAGTSPPTEPAKRAKPADVFAPATDNIDPFK